MVTNPTIKKTKTTQRNREKFSPPKRQVSKISYDDTIEETDRLDNLLTKLLAQLGE